MWTVLSTAQVENATDDNQYDLQARFFQYSFQPGSTIKNHITEITNLAYLLNEVKMPVNEQQILTKIVCTLPSAYRFFASGWRHVPKADKTLAILTSRLLQEEQELKKHSSDNDGVRPKTTEPSGEAAFYAQPSSSSQPYGRGRGSQHKKRGASSSLRGSYTSGRQHHNRWCTYCGRDNHYTDQCRIKERHDKVEAEKAELEKRRRDKGAMATDSQRELDVKEEDFSLVSTIPRFAVRSTGDWFADSGATKHMTDQLDVLDNYVTVPECSWSVTGIGASQYPVHGYGDVHIWTEVDGVKRPAIIRRVLYVPGLGTNLFSIRVVTKLGWTVTFTESQVENIPSLHKISTKLVSN